MVLSWAVSKPASEPMRLAGTCKQYSKKAIPQLTRIAAIRELCLYFRCPYQANVMNTLDAISSKMVSMRLRYAVACRLLTICLLSQCFGSLAQAQQQASKLMPVLLLSPARNEARSEWADVARGLRQAGLRAV